MAYRTRTYIAADWDSDIEVVEQLRKWKDSDYWSLNFTDAHDLTQARDGSLPCSIKKSLHERLEASKTFVLIVGGETDAVTKGGCQYCSSYSNSYGCLRSHPADYRSYVKYECDYADKEIPNIVVLYNYANVDRNKCPQALRWKGKHLAAYHYENYVKKWNYQDIRMALES